LLHLLTAACAHRVAANALPLRSAFGVLRKSANDRQEPAMTRRPSTDMALREWSNSALQWAAPSWSIRPERATSTGSWCIRGRAWR